MGSKRPKFWDKYFQWAVPIDITLGALIAVPIVWRLSIVCGIPEKELLTEVLNNLMSASISLAGFILAAITIIVTFKANLEGQKLNRRIGKKQVSKDGAAGEEIQSANTGFELLFSDLFYPDIIRVFRVAIYVLTFCFLAAFSVQVLGKWLYTNEVLLAALFLCVLLAATLLRCLYVMFTIITIEQQKDNS